MLWLIREKSSHQIVSCNIHKEGKRHQLWAEKSNGHSIKIAESEKEEEVTLVKKAIDYAIKSKDPVLELL